MSKKKYLLIGDHRTCENYGSIATCDQLIELMQPRRLSIIPITRMDQDYNFMPLVFDEFDEYAEKVKKGETLISEKRAIDNCDNDSFVLDFLVLLFFSVRPVQQMSKSVLRFSSVCVCMSSRFLSHQKNLSSRTAPPRTKNKSYRGRERAANQTLLSITYSIICGLNNYLQWLSQRRRAGTQVCREKSP